MKPGRGLLFPLVSGVVLIAGCEPHNDLTNDLPPVLEAPTAADLIAAHNRRLEHLDTIYARGVVELEWVDAEGRRRHEPQVDLEVWIDRPTHTAFQFDKFGEVYLWAGSDDQRFWLFDLTGDPRRLTMGRHDASMRLDTDAVLDVRPLALLDVLALSPLDERNVIDEVTRDDSRRAWVLEVTADSGRIRGYYAGIPFRPVRVELLDGAGEIVLATDLERYESAVLQDRSIDPPQLAEVMRVRDGAEDSSMEIFLDEISDGQDNPEIFDRLFDLDRLRRALRPDVVDDRSVH